MAVPSDTTRVRGVAYLSRPAWGADEALRFKPDGTENTPIAFSPFQNITVHHTAGVNNDPDPAATVRAIYQFHAVTNDWGDIGYHFLIDEAGTIYEGRYSGDDGLPAHDEDGKVVTAFHVGGFNSGNLGIALLGTLTQQGPTEAAREALTRLVRVLIRHPRRRPEGTRHVHEPPQRHPEGGRGDQRPPGLDGDGVPGRGHVRGAGPPARGSGRLRPPRSNRS